MTYHAFFLARMSRRQGWDRVAGNTPLLKLNAISALLQLLIKIKVILGFWHIRAELFPGSGE